MNKQTGIRLPQSVCPASSATRVSLPDTGTASLQVTIPPMCCRNCVRRGLFRPTVVDNFGDAYFRRPAGAERMGLLCRSWAWTCCALRSGGGFLQSRLNSATHPSDEHTNCRSLHPAGATFPH